MRQINPEPDGLPDPIHCQEGWRSGTKVSIMYVKSYRRMLNNPNTMPSKMLSYIKNRRKTTWFDLKKFLTKKYGYHYSGSYSASLRVLYLDDHINISGYGDKKKIWSILILETINEQRN